MAEASRHLLAREGFGCCGRADPDAVAFLVPWVEDLPQIRRHAVFAGRTMRSGLRRGVRARSAYAGILRGCAADDRGVLAADAIRGGGSVSTAYAVWRAVLAVYREAERRAGAARLGAAVGRSSARRSASRSRVYRA